jgi:hypothetical protein
VHFGSLAEVTPAAKTPKRVHRPAVLIVDANAQVDDNWRQQWDSLRLFHVGEV